MIPCPFSSTVEVMNTYTLQLTIIGLLCVRTHFKLQGVLKKHGLVKYLCLFIISVKEILYACSGKKLCFN